MSDHQQGGIRFTQVFLEPFGHFDVQVVGRFVEDQQVDRLKKQFDHSQTGALSARKYLHFFVDIVSAEHKSAQQVFGITFQLRRGNVIHRLENSQFFVQKRGLVLGEITDLYIVAECEFTGIIRNLPHNTFYERRFSFPVASYESHLFFSLNGEPRLFEHQMIPVIFRQFLGDYRIAARTGRRRKFQAQGRGIFFVHFDQL